MPAPHPIEIRHQPSETSCGPTCLQAVYAYYGDDIPLTTLIRQVRRLRTGGTLAVLLACHALRRGYSATINSWNITIFDPTWFQTPGIDIAAKLALQARHKPRQAKLVRASRAYGEFLKLGGNIRFEDLSESMLARHLAAGRPLLAGVSSTYLYQKSREHGRKLDDDDVAGEPQGHFVVLYGYDPATREVLVADPLLHDHSFGSHYYRIGIDRLINAILLGVLTYDAKLLLLTPPPTLPARRRRKPGSPAPS